MSLLKSKATKWSNVAMPIEAFVNDDAFQFLSTFEEMNEYDIVECGANKKVKPLDFCIYISDCMLFYILFSVSRD